VPVLGFCRFIAHYISNEYNRNAGMTVDRCGLLISITSKISSLVRFALLILEAARRPIREWQCRSIQLSHTYLQSSLHSCYTHLKCNRLYHTRPGPGGFRSRTAAGTARAGRRCDRFQTAGGDRHAAVGRPGCGPGRRPPLS